MNIKHLEHLLALADTGSFSRAAEKLFITQSALSRSIQSLEEDWAARCWTALASAMSSRLWAWMWCPGHGIL
jgi:DNA-binding transcriptional LysR family regulator